MLVRNITVGVLLVCFMAWIPSAWADAAEAGKACEEAKALRAKGDFEGALVAFKAAAKADPDNKEYFQECALLSRVLKIREQFKTEQDMDLWGRMGRGLYNYYRQYDINDEALVIATTLYAKMGCGDSAALVADVQLALGKDAEAAELLGGVDEAKCTPRSNLLLGVALARLGKAEEAKAIATKFEMPKECDAELCFDAARLYALVGEQAKAIESLQCTFENTPATWLDDVKAEAKKCPDFKSITGEEAFAKVLTTESKVKGCGGCSSSKSCSSKDKGGCSKSCEKDKKEGCSGHDHDKKGNDKE